MHTPPTTYIYTLSLHDALPIYALGGLHLADGVTGGQLRADLGQLHEHHIAQLLLRVVGDAEDRKSTRLNSSHEWRSYAVFCLKKKKMLCEILCLHMIAQPSIVV